MTINVAPTVSNKIGIIGATSYIIGYVIGSGIFITPTSILKHTNSVGLSLIVWLVGAFISLLGGFCYVELGTSIRHSGADYAYICFVKWYPIAFAFMCVGCIMHYPALLAIEATAFGEYIFEGIGSIFCLDLTNAMYAQKLLGFVLIWVLALLNSFSLKRIAAPFQVVTSSAKILSTTIIIITGFVFIIFKGKTENFQNMMQGSTYNVGAIVLALYASLFSYDGWDVLNFGMEEIENPRRTMPLSMFIGMMSVTVIYMTINVAYFAVLGVATIKSSPAVAFAFASRTLGGFQYVIPFLVGIVLVGSSNSIIFAGSRYLHAASRNGHLPTFISCIHPPSESPRAAIVVQIILAMIMSFAGNLDLLISYVSFASWLVRAFTLTALMWLRYRHVPVHPGAIRLPIILPFLFLLVCYALVIIPIVTGQVQVAAIALGILGVGLILYFIFIFPTPACVQKRLPAFMLTYVPWVLRMANERVTKIAQIIFETMPDTRTEQIYEHQNEQQQQPKTKTTRRISPAPPPSKKNVILTNIISDDKKKY